MYRYVKIFDCCEILAGIVFFFGGGALVVRIFFMEVFGHVGFSYRNLIS